MPRHLGAHALRAAHAAALACLLSAGARAQNSQPPDPDALRKKMDEITRQNQELQKQIDDLRRQMGQPAPTGSPAAPPPPGRAQTPQEALDRAVSGLPAQPTQPGAQGRPSPQQALDAAVISMPPSTVTQTTPRTGDLLSYRAGSATIRLIDISMVIDAAAGWSSQPDSSLLQLQGGDHDPRRRGFTLQAAEIGLAGAVDPYFTAQANINYNINSETGDSNVELEEAFITSMSLPYGLQVKAGQYFTEFGLLNPTHPHTWDWMDQPVILTRLFGGDGMRAPGARIAWLTPLPWYSQVIVGAQNGNGGTMPSFLSNEGAFAGGGIGGRGFDANSSVSGISDLVWSGRWENFFDLGKDTTIKVGVSGAIGPNATGSSEQTRIYGADFKLRWRPASNERGWPFVIWQSEIMARDYDAAAFVDPGGTPFGSTTLHDWGFYTQALYGFMPGWAAGLRYELARGSGDSVGGRDNDPFRDNRQRLSPLIVWQLSEFSRLRLQYNHDWADHLRGGHADSIFIGLEVLFGAHPAHTY